MTENGRWREFMAFIIALVYHERPMSEVPRLLEDMVSSLRSEDKRQEVEAMQKTMAQALEEKGKLEGKRETLLQMLCKRFGEVPAAMRTTIETTEDLQQFKE